MSCEIVEYGGCVLAVRITGRLSKPEIDALQGAAIDVIRREGSIRILVIAERFEGWEDAENFRDTSFMTHYDLQIERIAIVGEKRWQDLVSVFTGTGLRSAQVEYFQPEQRAQAHAWLVS